MNERHTLNAPTPLQPILPPRPIIVSRRLRMVWLVAGGMLTVIALLAGARAVWIGVGRLTMHTAAQRQSYAHPVSRIEVDVDGNLSLAAGGAGRVTVERRLEWSGPEPTIEEAWVGDTLRIVARCADSSGPFKLRPECSIDYALVVPRDATVDARSSSDHLRARDLRGELRLSESSGDVTVTNVTGPLWMHTTSGAITGSGLRSTQVEVRTEAGNVDLRFAAAPQRTTITTTRGDVVLAVPADDIPYRIRIDTPVGNTNVSIRQNAAAARTIYAQTTRGDVDIRYGS
jgi:autotransporter translocation and assembly factor TamB